jgi:hypothetical protein
MATASRPNRKALRQARAAQFLGERRKQAEEQGGSAVLAVAMDQLRSTLAQLPEQTRAHATEKAIRALDQLRQNLTES